MHTMYALIVLIFIKKLLYLEYINIFLNRDPLTNYWAQGGVPCSTLEYIKGGGVNIKFLSQKSM